MQTHKTALNVLIKTIKNRNNQEEIAKKLINITNFKYSNLTCFILFNVLYSGKVKYKLAGVAFVAAVCSGSNSSLIISTVCSGNQTSQLGYSLDFDFRGNFLSHLILVLGQLKISLTFSLITLLNPYTLAYTCLFLRLMNLYVLI